jgi:phage-related minor tail protein
MRDDYEILEQEAGGADRLTAELSRTLKRLGGAAAETGTEVEGLSRGMTRGLRSAFDGVVMDGDRVSDALKGVGRSLLDTVYASAVKPLSQGLGGALSQGVSSLLGGAFADGGAFVQGRVTPFAKGGVVSRPTTFPMRGGTGLMGEAGPEAIMPLTRGADGRLGVRAEAGGAPSVTINVTTPDVAGFRRSRSQVAAEMSRALGRGSRNR